MTVGELEVATPDDWRTGACGIAVGVTRAGRDGSLTAMYFRLGDLVIALTLKLEVAPATRLDAITKVVAVLLVFEIKVR